MADNQFQFFKRFAQVRGHLSGDELVRKPVEAVFTQVKFATHLHWQGVAVRPFRQGGVEGCVEGQVLHNAGQALLAYVDHVQGVRVVDGRQGQ